MKSYEEMANEVFRRREAYETAQKHRRKAMRRAAGSLGCACLAVLIGVGVWQSGVARDRRSLPPASSTGISDTVPSGEGVWIPPIEPPKGINGESADMIGLVVYQGHVYTQAESYSGADAAKMAGLIGERLGHATGTIDEWSSQEAYATEFASTYEGDIYAVKGYSTDFRLCFVSVYEDENGNSAKWVQFLERLNGISLTDGEDLFGDRLHLRGRIAAVRYQTEEDWNVGRQHYRELVGLTAEELEAFVEELYAGQIVHIADSDYDALLSERERVMVYFRLDDDTVVRLQLTEGGYVLYPNMDRYYVKLSGDAFDTVFRTCR